MTNRFTTIENARDVLDGLFRDTPEEYTCEVKKELVRPDRVDDVAITLMLKRLKSAAHSYKETGDMVKHYKTSAHWQYSSEEFEAEVIIDFTKGFDSAELSLAAEASEIFSRLPAETVQSITRHID